MRKFILLAVTALTFIATQALAIPTLQLYIPGATYDDADETWVISSNQFELWVIGDGKAMPIEDVYLAAAYATGETGSIALTPVGGSTALAVSLSGGDDTVPLMGDGSPLPSHGIYGPGTSWFSYFLGDFTSDAETIYDYTTGTAGTGTGQINKYNVDVTGYSSGLHFDAYDHVAAGNHTKHVFAPNSHDAGSTNPVPEPGTVMLLGAGFLSLAIYTKRRKNA